MEFTSDHSQGLAFARKARQGSAPIELTLALPIFMVLLSFIFAVCSAAVTRIQVTSTARNNTFAKRHQPWLHASEELGSLDLGSVGIILGSKPLVKPEGGMVQGTASGRPEGLFGPLKALTQEATREFFVMGGVWDQQEIPFKKHPALTLTDKATYFGVAGGDLGKLDRLAGFAMNFSGSDAFGQLRQRVLQGTESARQQINSRIAEIQRELSQRARDLKQKQSELARLRQQPNPDGTAIQRKEIETKKLQSEIGSLRVEAEKQKMAAANLGVDLDLPPVGSSVSAGGLSTLPDTAD